MRTDDSVEELTSGPDPPDRPERPRRRSAVLVAAVALVAVAVVAVVLHASSQAPRLHAHAAPPPSAAPLDADQAPAWVFLEPLPGCQRTQSHHRLRLAIGVTNLGAAPLRLVGLTAVLGTRGVAVTGLQVGSRPCPTGDTTDAVQLLPSHEATVGIGLRGDPDCHADGSVSVRLTFRGSAGRILHAESSNLLTSATQRLLGCRSA